MRLFTAIDLNAALLKRLEQTLSALRPIAAIQWSRPQNLHITTKFIGEFPEARLEELKETLQPLTRRPPFSVSVRALAWFPRVLYAGVDGGSALRELAQATGSALAAIGIPPEPKSYSPHLTLARIKDKTPLESLRLAVANEQVTGFGQFEADRFWLYRSELTPRGSVYTKLAGFSFES